jgi:phosphoglucosamine mutase
LTLPRFGTDGVRGVANADLTPDVALALGRAAAEVVGGSSVVIGRDTRRSGPLLEAALVAGFCASGVDVELLGVVPTPAVAWAAARRGSSGVVISASHNPFADNGIKLFAPGGTKLDDDAERAVEARLHALLGQPAGPGPTGAGVGTVVDGAGVDDWIGHLIGSCDVALDGLRVVVDAANGAAAGFVRPVLEALGVAVELIGDRPDGTNINDGCGSTHPEALAAEVLAVGADLGLALDGDADRLLAVDGQGRLVDGDHLLAILARDLHGRGVLAHDTVVVTVMTNLGFRLAMSDAGIRVVETPVGDRAVLRALDAGGYVLGGEQSGHLILRRLASTGDGLLSAVQVLAAVRRAGRPLAELAATAMTAVPQILRNVRIERRDPTLLDRLADPVAAAEARLGGDGRVVVRASGTEPLIRVMVEAIDGRVAEEVCADLVAAVEAASRTPSGSVAPAP